MFRRAVLHAALLFALVACAATYPLVRLDHPQVPNADDSYFNVWRLAWVAHQLPIDPTRLFDANIFHPARNTLAYSDAMLGLGIAAAPAIWLGVHPVVVHNVLMIASFVAAALGAFVLCRHLTKSVAAGIVGGLIFGFAPYRFAHIMHLELLWTAPMPLALFVLHRASERDRSVSDGLLLGLLVALQAYCSLYYAAFLALFIGLWTVFRALMSDGLVRRRIAVCVVVGALSGFALSAPYGYVYYQARQEVGSRDASEIRRYSAEPFDYLQPNPDNRLYRRPPAQAHEERSLFPGITAMLLAVLALLGQRNRLVVLYGLLLVLAFDLSLGLNGVLYPVVSSVVPLLSSLRAPSRFASLFLLSLSVLAGIGWHWVGSKLPRWGLPIATVLVAVVCLAEYWSAPLMVRAPIMRPPHVQQWLRTVPNTVIVDLPLPEPESLWNYEVTFQYYSIFHWHRLVNGYSGYPAKDYVRTLTRLEDFPTPRAIAELRSLGVQYVVVHERMYQGAEFGHLVERLVGHPDFAEPVTLQDPVDPAYVFPLRPADGS
jgi:hypothetical protein